MLEREIEEYLVKCVEKRGGEAVKLTVPGRRGWPDRLIVLQDLILFAELKRPKGGKLSPSQRWVHTRLTELGAPIWKLNSIAAVDDMMARLFPPSLPPISRMWAASQQDEEEID